MKTTTAKHKQTLRTDAAVVAMRNAVKSPGKQQQQQQQQR